MSENSIFLFINGLQSSFEADDPTVAAKRMEADHVARLREQFAALGRGDFDGFADFLDAGVEMEFFGAPNSPFVGRRRGRKDVMDGIRDNFSRLEHQQPDILSVVAQGNIVVVIAREKGVWRATGREYATHWVQLFEFRNGKIIRFQCVFDSGGFAEAINPVGKSMPSSVS